MRNVRHNRFDGRKCILSTVTSAGLRARPCTPDVKRSLPVRCEALDAVAEVGYRGVEAGGIAGRDRVRTDQCTAAWPPSSSRARSHTVTTRSPSPWTSLMCRGRSRGSGSRWRRAAAIAPGSIAGPGWVPADAAGTAAGPAPQRGGQVRARRVGGAHEQHPPRRTGPAAWPPSPGRRESAAGRSAGGRPRTGGGDHPGLLQHVQMVRQQVRRHRQHAQ